MNEHLLRLEIDSVVIIDHVQLNADVVIKRHKMDYCCFDCRVQAI